MEIDKYRMISYDNNILELVCHKFTWYHHPIDLQVVQSPQGLAIGHSHRSSAGGRGRRFSNRGPQRKKHWSWTMFFRLFWQCDMFCSWSLINSQVLGIPLTFQILGFVDETWWKRCCWFGSNSKASIVDWHPLTSLRWTAIALGIPPPDFVQHL